MSPATSVSRPSRVALRFLCLSLLALAAAGCSFLPEPKSDPTRYYVLGGAGAADENPAKAEGGLVVGLRAVQVPAYLGGKAMIVRSHGNEIDYRDFSRWAEPLDTAISLRVADRLKQAPGVARVLTYPFPLEIARDVDVKLRVLRCEGVRGDGDTAQFAVEVQVFSAGSGDLMLSKVLTAPAAEWNDKDYGQLAELLGQGVSTVADEMVTLLPAPVR